VDGVRVQRDSESRGEPGTSDQLGIVVTGAAPETRSPRVMSRGNIQFHD